MVPKSRMQTIRYDTFCFVSLMAFVFYDGIVCVFVLLSKAFRTFDVLQISICKSTFFFSFGGFF